MFDGLLYICIALYIYCFVYILCLQVTATCNLSIVLTDGPYGGGVCGATNHSHHNSAKDSVYQQYRLQADFYRKLFTQGKFIRQPDTYYFDGGQHSPLGYSEQQYSLPRWTDLTVSRQVQSPHPLLVLS